MESSPSRFFLMVAKTTRERKKTRVIVAALEQNQKLTRFMQGQFRNIPDRMGGQDLRSDDTAMRSRLKEVFIKNP